MGFRFRKTFSFGKGFRINLSRRGVSFGASIPGTGISVNSGQVGGGRRQRGGADVGCGQGCLGCAGLIIVVVVVGVLLSPKSPDALRPVPKPATKPKEDSTASVIDAPTAESPANADRPGEGAPVFPEKVDEPAAEEKPSILLPQYVKSKSRKAGEPIYVRAVVLAAKLKKSKVEADAMRLHEAVGNAEDNFVVDFFDSNGPLAWSGLFAVSNSAWDHWLCRVTISPGSPPVFELATNRKTKKPRREILEKE